MRVKCGRHLCEVERMSVVLSWVGGVGQVEVERRLLQHLLVAPVVVLAVGGEPAAVAPVLGHRRLVGGEGSQG